MLCATGRGSLWDCFKLWVSKTCCKCACKCKQALCFHLLCAFIILPLVPASRGVWLISFHYVIAYATSMARPQLCVAFVRLSSHEKWFAFVLLAFTCGTTRTQNSFTHLPTRIIYDSQLFHNPLPPMTCPRSVKQLN